MKALPGSLLILSEIYLRPNLIVPIPTLLNTTQYIIHYIIYYCRPLPPDRYRALQSKQGKNYYDGFSTTPSSILTYGFVPLKTIRPKSSSLLVHTDLFSPITVWFIFDQSYIGLKCTPVVFFFSLIVIVTCRIARFYAEIFLPI